MERPIYDASIDKELQEGDNELGIDMIAFTSDPAIMVKGVAFKSQSKSHFADEKKYRITAPAMIPMSIYRSDEDGDYDVNFKEETIDEMHKQFMSNLNNKDLFNLEHEEEVVPAFILEAWIVDHPKQDKAFSTFGIEVPKGTLMVTAQITDKDYYNKLVENEQVGLSIEGFLGLAIPTQLTNNTNSMKLEDGKYSVGDVEYIVKNGKMTLSTEVKAEEDVKEEEEVELAEDKEEVEAELADETEDEVKEEELAEEVVEEEVEVEAEVNPEADADAILAIVNPVIDEKINVVLELLAEIRNEMAEGGEVATEDVEVNLCNNIGFKRFAKAFPTNN